MKEKSKNTKKSCKKEFKDPQSNITYISKEDAIFYAENAVKKYKDVFVELAKY